MDIHELDDIYIFNSISRNAVPTYNLYDHKRATFKHETSDKCYKNRIKKRRSKNKNAKKARQKNRK